MKKIENIIIHCSDSEFGSAAMIRQWHLQNGWKDIGYHFVILNGLIVPNTQSGQKQLYVPFMDGMIEVGRHLDGDDFVTSNEVGSHALGYNDKSAGVCLIGKKTFTKKQFDSLIMWLDYFLPLWKLPIEVVKGHYEVSPNRTCPNFDMKRFRMEYAARSTYVNDGGVYVPQAFDPTKPIPQGHEHLYTKQQLQQRINHLLKTSGWTQEAVYLVAYRDKMK